jgi:hypothetical protein
MDDSPGWLGHGVSWLVKRRARCRRRRGSKIENLICSEGSSGMDGGREHGYLVEGRQESSGE